MRNTAVNADRLLAACRDIGDAVLDPARWPGIMAQIGGAAGAAGVVLLRATRALADAPRTESAHEAYSNYFSAGWHRRDTLAERGFPLFMAGRPVISEQDLVTPEEMKRHAFYNEVLLPFHFKWFAGIGFMAGSALWAMIIIRAPRQGPFEQYDRRSLALLTSRLSEAATLSKAVGYAALASASNVLQLVAQPALALDRFGVVIEMNDAMGQIFDDNVYIRGGRLAVRDPRGDLAMRELAAQLCTTPDSAALSVKPIGVQRTAKPPLAIRILPVHGAARSPFLGARALLTFSAIETKPTPDGTLLCDTFGLTRAEAEVAALAAQGHSVAAIARWRGVALVTVRNQMRTIQAKTGTHRQSELVALLSRL